MVKCVNADSQSFHHNWAENMNGLWWKIKKIISGKINSDPPYLTAILREGGGKIKKNTQVTCCTIHRKFRTKSCY